MARRNGRALRSLAADGVESSGSSSEMRMTKATNQSGFPQPEWSFTRLRRSAPPVR